MRALILAAGFGTRMGSITAKTAKPLLPVAGKPVVEHLTEKILKTGTVSDISVITNGYYQEQFKDWADGYGACDISLINNGVLTNETRLGAIADLNLAISHIGNDDSLMVMAGDNIFEFDFIEIVRFQQSVNADVVASYHQPDKEKLSKTGVAILDDSGRIIEFHEKPAEPRSNHAIPCLYIFQPQTLKMIPEYIHEGLNADATGNFINWLYKKIPVYAYCFSEPLHSIGDVASYEKTRQKLEGKIF